MQLRITNMPCCFRMYPAIFIFLSIFRGAYAAFGCSTNVSSDEHSSEHTVPVLARVCDGFESGEHQAPLSSTPLRTAALGTSHRESSSLDYRSVCSGERYPSTKETVNRALGTEQVRSKCTSEYLTPDHGYAAAGCERSIQKQSCSDLYTARAPAVSTSRACSTGSVMHPSSRSHAPLDQEVQQVCHPCGYSTLNPNAVPCASTYTCICGSILFIRHMKLKMFTNFTHNAPPVFLASPDFVPAIFRIHEDEHKETAFNTLRSFYNEYIDRSLSYRTKEPLKIVSDELEKLLTRSELQGLRGRWLGYQQKKLRISHFVFVCELLEYLKALIAKCRVVHGVLQKIEAIIENVSLVNTALTFKRPELMKSLLLELKNEHASSFSCFESTTHKISYMLSEILKMLKNTIERQPREWMCDIFAVKWISDVKNYVFNCVINEIIVPRTDNAASFVTVLIAFLESIGTDGVTQCAQGPSARAQGGTKRPDEQNMHTRQAIMSYMDEFETLVSAVRELNLSYASITGTLTVNLNILRQVMVNISG
ncbi:hypothetical protein VCUG_00135 [Vavraia culicis subsp. floridensis]|uniref:Uncharacterized protein n=1 Tax=Vavraia culicis (isolate floridensis) TaxID=948595 RepID=L2GXD3_VAVCU|nr:uncharacterized protein VCUG_00135 [Vavraia culicis subsp. floridensis]ELA48299.2 hypothetical protein VCUG_00135 [Vavraia culicis subsp. floridensis]